MWGYAVSCDQFGFAVQLVRRDAESCVLTLAGELSLRSAGTVCGALTKALLEVDRVLVDVSRLRLTWTPAVQVFPSTLAAMGGWPWARLMMWVAGWVVGAAASSGRLPTNRARRHGGGVETGAGELVGSAGWSSSNTS